MEVKENTEQFKAACKSILDFITEYAKSDVNTRGDPYRVIDLGNSISVPVSLNNTSMNGYDFTVGIKLRGVGHVDTDYNLILIKYRADRIIYNNYMGYRQSPVYDRLLIEIFKDAMVDLDSYQTNIFYKLLVDTNKNINISTLEPTSCNRQKDLLEYCVANNFSIYSNQLTLIIEHVDIDWIFGMLPHFKGLVKLNCRVQFDYQTNFQQPAVEDLEETSDDARNRYITGTCKGVEEKLILILSTDVKDCVVSSRCKQYQGQNIADRIKHKF